MLKKLSLHGLFGQKHIRCRNTPPRKKEIKNLFGNNKSTISLKIMINRKKWTVMSKVQVKNSSWEHMNFFATKKYKFVKINSWEKQKNAFDKFVMDFRLKKPCQKRWKDRWDCSYWLVFTVFHLFALSFYLFRMQKVADTTKSPHLVRKLRKKIVRQNRLKIIIYCRQKGLCMI